MNRVEGEETRQVVMGSQPLMTQKPKPWRQQGNTLTLGALRETKQLGASSAKKRVTAMMSVGAFTQTSDQGTTSKNKGLGESIRCRGETR